MSNFDAALKYTLNFEDPKGTYLPTPDVGGEAIAGVNSAEWPEDYAKIAAVPENQRAVVVAEFYSDKFWVPSNIDLLNSQDLANRVFDCEVNMGRTQGIRILQKAINSFNQAVITVDGVLGNRTLYYVDQTVPSLMLTAFRNARANHYKQIVDANPKDAKYLQGWLARALA